MAVAAAGIAVVTFMVASWPAGAPDGVPEKLLDRIWLDRTPDDPQDSVAILLLQGDPQVGVFQRASAYEGDYALFGWQGTEKGRLEIEMWQTGKIHRVRVRVAEKGCEPYDYCLRLRGAPRGPAAYVSMEDWVIDPGPELGGAALRALVARKAEALPSTR